MVAAGCSAALVSSYRTHEALSQNTGVFIELALRNWNLTRRSVSETGKGSTGHGDKRRPLSRLLCSWGDSRTLGSFLPLRENKCGIT